MMSVEIGALDTPPMKQAMPTSMYELGSVTISGNHCANASPNAPPTIPPITTAGPNTPPAAPEAADRQVEVTFTATMSNIVPTPAQPSGMRPVGSSASCIQPYPAPSAEGCKRE